MEIIVKAFEIGKEIEEFNQKVTEENSIIVLAKLEAERNKIVDVLKSYKEAGAIKSIFIPKNKRIQKELDTLTTIKRQIRNSIEKIKTIF